MDSYDDIRGWSPIQFLTPADRAWLECRYQTEFRDGYCELRISSIRVSRRIKRVSVERGSTVITD